MVREDCAILGKNPRTYFLTRDLCNVPVLHGAEDQLPRSIRSFPTRQSSLVRLERYCKHKVDDPLYGNGSGVYKYTYALTYAIRGRDTRMAYGVSAVSGSGPARPETMVPPPSSPPESHLELV
jgi:hypothetical protein